MTVPLTHTKVLLPRRRPDLLSRQRLLDLLYDLLDHKLIIIAAPAGYGKTSLLIDLAHRTELPVCWYALDALDRDPQRFIAHFIASIAHRFPRFGQRSTTLLHDLGQTSAADLNGLPLDQLATAIVNEAYEHIREHFVLVLDDYHFVDGSEEIDYFINRFVQDVDENCHLVVASRTLLTLSDLPLMVARSQVGGLSFEELAFRADEIQSLVLQNYHLTMPHGAAEELARETEGWITGLLLSTQTMWQGMADRLRLARASGVGLYDYLAQQVLDQQPAPVRDFLLRTSLLEEFDADLCEAALGPARYPGGEDWHSLINTILRNNLFVLRIGDEGTWLRYHHLFRDFLQARLAQDRPDEEKCMRRRLAEVYAEREEWEKAYNLYRRLEDVAAVADLIEQAGPSLAKGGRMAMLAEWLDSLPAEMLNSRPDLLSLRGMAATMLGEAEQGLSLQSQAEAAFRQAGDRPRLARTLVRRAVDHRLLGKYQASLADADEALAIARPDESPGDVWAEALRAKGMSLYCIGQLAEAAEWLAQSLAAYTALNDEQREALLRMELGMAHASAGHYDQALRHFNHALHYWRRTNNIIQQANLLNNLGVLHHLKGDYEQAKSLLEEALACARQSRYTRIEALALSSIGDLYADLEAPDAALAAYRQARETARRVDYRFLLLYLDLAEAALARSKRKLSQARGLIESARQVATESGSGFQHGLCQLEAGRLALAEETMGEAIVHLGDAAQRFDDGGQYAESARAYLYLAIAHHTAHDEKAATDCLAHAFQSASTLGSQHPLVVAGREAKELLETTRSDSAAGRPAVRLLKQIAQFEHKIPALRRSLRRQASTVPFAPPKLTIQALGRVLVTVDGRPIANAEWQAQKKVRDLFFFLLAHPDGLTKEAMAAIYWPDSTPAQLKLQFKNTMYRLRHALGQDVVVFDQDSYQFNRNLDYEYDVETFLGKLAQAEAAANGNSQVTAYQAALHLYKGDYLPEIQSEWVWTQREQLRDAYLGATLKLAGLYLESGSYDLALDYCQRALASDPCLEEAHRLAMRAYAATGNQASIARQFERCRQALLKEVSARPSSQTQSLYETLMR
jgi:ATP/maltotriose-dependent transcriptional regulator MalT/two-component SAPR family response regulator